MTDTSRTSSWVSSTSSTSRGQILEATQMIRPSQLSEAENPERPSADIGVCV
jgi:hypothetical protein